MDRFEVKMGTKHSTYQKKIMHAPYIWDHYKEAFVWGNSEFVGDDVSLCTDEKWVKRLKKREFGPRTLLILTMIERIADAMNFEEKAYIEELKTLR